MDYHALTINPGNVSNLTGYQVKLDENSVGFENIDFTAILANGADIRFFADASLTIPLSYWIEEWDDDAETFSIWVELADDDETIYMVYGNPSLSSASSGPDTFPDFFDHFVNTKTEVMPWGADAGFSSAFCPLNRRLYMFGNDLAATGDGGGESCVSWVDIDTWEVGFVSPGLNTPVNAAAVMWSVTHSKFFIYGGRPQDSVTRINSIQTFDPINLVFATLSEVMPTIISESAVFEYPATGNNYLAGGWNATSQFDTIWVHNIGAGTVSDTGANLPTARSNMGYVWVPEKSLAYFVAGWGGGNTNYATILTYDPATPGTDPVTLAATLDDDGENPGVANDNGVLVIAGGVNRGAGVGGSDLYTNAMYELDTSDDSITTLVETLDRADDDIIGFYDSTNDRSYFAPVLHSSQLTDNKSHEKVVVATYNRNTQSLSAEPSLGTWPTGWVTTGNASESSTRVPMAVGGSMVVLADDETNKFVGMENSIGATLTGELMLESRVSINKPSDSNYQMRVGNAAFGASELAIYRNNSTTNWLLLKSGSDQTIAAIPTAEYQIIGIGIDTVNAKVYGLLNRANKTAAFNYRHGGAAVEKVWFNTATATRMGFAVDWVLARKWTTGTEPSITVGPAVEESSASSISTSSSSVSSPSSTSSSTSSSSSSSSPSSISASSASSTSSSSASSSSASSPSSTSSGSSSSVSSSSSVLEVTILSIEFTDEVMLKPTFTDEIFYGNP